MKKHILSLLLLLFSVASFAQNAAEYEKNGDAAVADKDYTLAYARYCECMKMGSDVCAVKLGELIFLHAKEMKGAVDYKEAFATLKQLAEKGNTDVQTYLSLMYRDGIGVTKDASMAIKWFTAATQGGYASPSTSSVTTPATKIAFDWAPIPAGTFTMGSPASEAERGSDEIPHEVTLSAFKMSKYEVTFAQFDAFCNATSCKKPGDEGWGRGNRPVMNVSWDDAQAFCQWAGVQLPTEAQWEYACRAGTATPFNTGSNLTTNQGNYNGNYPYTGNAKGTYLGKTTTVGSYAANAWGLYDMHGNVWEWCADWKEDYSTSSQTNPRGAASGTYRVLRGGSWGDYAGNCRSAYRSSSTPSDRGSTCGFRVVFPG